MGSKTNKDEKASASFKERYGGKKFTAESIEASFTKASKNRKESRESGNAGKVWKYIFTGVLVAGIGVSAVIWNNNNNNTANIMAANDVTIVGLEAELKDISLKGATVQSADDIQRQIHNASEKGGRIATLQNNFIDVMLMPDGQARDEAIESEKNELRPFFAEALIEGSFNPLTPWYIKWDPNVIPAKMAPSNTYGWKFASAYPTDSMDKFTVIWINTENDSDKILAWAKGTYDSTSQEITAISVGKTTYGQTFVPGTVATDEDELIDVPATPGESIAPATPGEDNA